MIKIHFWTYDNTIFGNGVLLKEFYKYIILAITSATEKMKHDLIRPYKISVRFPEGAVYSSTFRSGQQDFSGAFNSLSGGKAGSGERRGAIREAGKEKREIGGRRRKGWKWESGVGKSF